MLVHTTIIIVPIVISVLLILAEHGVAGPELAERLGLVDVPAEAVADVQS